MMAIVRMVVVLSVLCGLSGFALSYLKMITATAIEEQELTLVIAIHGLFFASTLATDCIACS